MQRGTQVWQQQDIATSEQGYESLTASSIIDLIGKAFIELFKRPEETVQQESN